MCRAARSRSGRCGEGDKSGEPQLRGRGGEECPSCTAVKSTSTMLRHDPAAPIVIPTQVIAAARLCLRARSHVAAGVKRSK